VWFCLLLLYCFHFVCGSYYVCQNFTEFSISLWWCTKKLPNFCRWLFLLLLWCRSLLFIILWALWYFVLDVTCLLDSFCLCFFGKFSFCMMATSCLLAYIKMCPVVCCDLFCIFYIGILFGLHLSFYILGSTVNSHQYLFSKLAELVLLLIPYLLTFCICNMP